MLVIYNSHQIHTYRTSSSLKGQRVGFVPTMGALHEGHASLVRASLQQCDVTVCSIFVNPTQFNDPEDLKNYPRTQESDLEILAGLGCDIAFVPEVEDIYPSGEDTALNIDFGHLARGMEGKFRPGHFEGVAQVIKRFCDIILPEDMFLGQKDYQQVAVVRHLVEMLELPVNIIACSTVREPDGLAMSSRNGRLTAEMRKEASVIYRTLKRAKAMFEEGAPLPKINTMAEELFKASPIALEYFEIVDGDTLERIEERGDTENVVACVAAWAGEVRLIDNVVFGKL